MTRMTPLLLAGTMLSTLGMGTAAAQAPSGPGAQAGGSFLLAQQTEEDAKRRRGREGREGRQGQQGQRQQGQTQQGEPRRQGSGRPGQRQPQQTQPTQTQPTRVRPQQTQQDEPRRQGSGRPGQRQPQQTQPTQTQPTRVRPQQTQQDEPRRQGSGRPGQRQPQQTQPTQTQPTRVQPTQTQQGEPRRQGRPSGQRQPQQTQPTQTQPTRVQPTQTQQGEPRRQGRPSGQQQRQPAFGEPRRPRPRPTGPIGIVGDDGPRRLDVLRGQRREERRGDRTVIREPGGREIIRDSSGRSIVRREEGRRFQTRGVQVRTEQRGSERFSIALRPGGIEIITVVDSEGRLLRRVRRDRSGREVVLIDNRRRGSMAYDPYVRLAPPRLRIPRERYWVLAGVAAPALIYETLMAPPVEALERPYTLEEVRYSDQLRARMPRIDLDTVTFDTGSWELTPEQIDRLEVIADAILRVLEENPDEVFMIEGHTDAVGNELDNLSLSDRRAEAVALVLSEHFDVPPENLVTQGYGQQYLKIDTPHAERQNRRVTVLRVTPLLGDQTARRAN